LKKLISQEGHIAEYKPPDQIICDSSAKKTKCFQFKELNYYHVLFLAKYLLPAVCLIDERNHFREKFGAMKVHKHLIRYIPLNVQNIKHILYQQTPVNLESN
jgi:hypothetical protein